MRLILTFLTEEQINEINNKVFNKKATYEITACLEGLTRSQKAIVNEHIRKLKYPKSTGILGSKSEPYNSEKQMIKGTPNYTWDELPSNDKQFYEEFGKKKLKKSNGKKNKQMD